MSASYIFCRDLPGREYGHNLNDIICKILFKGRVLAGIDNDYLNAEVLTEGEHQFRPKTEQSILMASHQPSDLARADAVNGLPQSTLWIIETSANIGENFIRPKLCCAKTFEKCHLASEVVFLASGRYPSVGQSCSR